MAERDMSKGRNMEEKKRREKGVTGRGRKIYR
jgi:hypothetical protein